MDPRSPSDPEFWQELYASGGDRWELGQPAPPLAAYLEADPPRGQDALVVGCGRGHEARLLARLGAQVTAIDLAPAAITDARALLARDEPHLHVDFQVGDLFDLRGRPPAFDLVLEHTCFCAIEPTRRGDYVRAIADALRPGGRLIALFYAHGRPGGPPYTVDEDELLRRFQPDFEVERLLLAEGSIPQRAGHELLGVLRRRG
ncbi:MAG: methyltransferase domain-containing protein [Nannocystis sp.]|jgi:SAM-dependent methyltransferase|nr:methyltransferase domain-containing protein [Nannocystis sp.]